MATATLLDTIDLAAIDRSALHTEPYPFFIGSDFLRHEAIADIERDFPELKKPGYLTVDEVGLHGRFKRLVDELEGPELTGALSKKFGIDLSPYPQLTTIMARSIPKYGAIHTDGASKVMTMLVYLNDSWSEDAGGRLRVLHNGHDFEPFAAEVPPTTGTMFAFLRRDNSWHGHLPFEGERRVVQVAWITSREELDRKKRRNRVAQLFKGLFRR